MKSIQIYRVVRFLLERLAVRIDLSQSEFSYGQGERR